MFEQPDGFLILKITMPESEPLYKLFSGWYGGYLDGDRWRLNSGITLIEEDNEWNGKGKFYYVHGNSSTVYHIHEDQYGKLPSYCSGVLDNMKSTAEEAGGEIQVITIEEYFKEN